MQFGVKQVHKRLPFHQMRPPGLERLLELRLPMLFMQFIRVAHSRRTGPDVDYIQGPRSCRPVVSRSGKCSLVVLSYSSFYLLKECALPWDLQLAQAPLKG